MFGLRLLLLLCLSVPLWAAESTLTVMTDERHPLAWQDKGVAQGIAYDLVTATMKELGLTPAIIFTSFNRGLKQTQSENNRVFFSVTRSAERERTLKWAGPLVNNDIYIYKRKDSPLNIVTLDDLRGLTSIGVPKGMSQDSFLTEQALPNVMRSDTIANVLRALLNKRVDVVAIGQLTARSTLLEIGANPALIEETPLKLYDNPLYIAFSLNVSDETVARWQKALDKVKREHYNLISNKYLH